MSVKAPPILDLLTRVVATAMANQALRQSVSSEYEPIQAQVRPRKKNSRPSGGNQTATKKPAAATAGRRIKNSPTEDTNDASK